MSAYILITLIFIAINLIILGFLVGYHLATRDNVLNLEKEVKRKLPGYSYPPPMPPKPSVKQNSEV